MAEILFDKKDGIARITFNRPEVRNAITVDMFRKLGQVIDEAIQDHDIRILILSGSGQSFSVGADIKEANEMMRKSYQDRTSVSSIREIVVLEQKVISKLILSDKVSIAAIHGYAVGAGLEISLACDILIAAENAKLGFAETQIGLNIGGGTTKFLPMLIGTKKAMELAFTGEFINAQEAFRIGLVNKLTSMDGLEDAVNDMAKTILQRPPLGIAFNKRLLRRAPFVDFETVIDMEADATVSLLLTEDFIEATSAISEKRTPVFKGK